MSKFIDTVENVLVNINHVTTIAESTKGKGIMTMVDGSRHFTLDSFDDLQYTLAGEVVPASPCDNAIVGSLIDCDGAEVMFSYCKVIAWRISTDHTEAVLAEKNYVQNVSCRIGLIQSDGSVVVQDHAHFNSVNEFKRDVIEMAQRLFSTEQIMVSGGAA